MKLPILDITHFPCELKESWFVLGDGTDEQESALDKLLSSPKLEPATMTPLGITTDGKLISACLMWGARYTVYVCHPHNYEEMREYIEDKAKLLAALTPELKQDITGLIKEDVSTLSWFTNPELN